jgi:hypothetical protein
MALLLQILHTGQARKAEVKLGSPEDMYATTMRNTLIETRDALDAAVPKILSLSGPERRSLSLQTTLAAGMLISTERTVDPIPSDPKTLKPAPRTPDRRVEALNSMARVLDMDDSKVSPKEYEAMVRQVWKSTKATLDEMLDRGAPKQKSDAKGTVKK